MRFFTSVCILVAAALTTGATTAVLPRTADLLGNWEEDPGTCEGDNYITYNANGTFEGYDFEGRWELHGSTLITMTTKQMVGDDEKMRSVKSPKKLAVTILSSSHTRRIERWSDSSVHHFHRCK